MAVDDDKEVDDEDCDDVNEVCGEDDCEDDCEEDGRGCGEEGSEGRSEEGEAAGKPAP